MLHGECVRVCVCLLRMGGSRIRAAFSCPFTYGTPLSLSLAKKKKWPTKARQGVHQKVLCTRRDIKSIKPKTEFEYSVGFTHTQEVGFLWVLYISFNMSRDGWSLFGFF